MSTGALVAVIIVVVVVVAALVTGAMAAARRRRLQRRFGPEYDRVVGERGSQLKAESELASRERRIRSLHIRPLGETARANYASQWQIIQEQFVDQPENSVVKAQALVTTVMKHRGYPLEGHDQMLADLSVEHASTLEQYRLACTISRSAAEGKASTEDLRQAMIKYRALFSDLLGGAVGPDGGAAGPDGGAAGPDRGMVPADGGADIRPAEARGAPGSGPVTEASAVNADPAGADDAGVASAATGELSREPAPRRRR